MVPGKYRWLLRILTHHSLNRASVTRGLTVGYIGGLPVILAFLLLDHYLIGKVNPAAFHYCVVIRVGMAILCGLFIGASFLSRDSSVIDSQHGIQFGTEGGRRLLNSLGVALALLVCLGHVELLKHTGGPDSIYTVGIFYVFFAVAALVPWHPLISGTIYGLTLGYYCLLIKNSPPFPALSVQMVVNLVLLIGAACFSWFVSRSNYVRQSITDHLYELRSCKFQKDCIHDIEKFISLLDEKESDSSVVKFLNREFPESLKAKLRGCRVNALDVESVIHELIEEINKIIASVRIWEDTLFEGVKFSDTVNKLLLKQPIGDGVVRLNRVIIEDEFDGIVRTNLFTIHHEEWMHPKDSWVSYASSAISMAVVIISIIGAIVYSGLVGLMPTKGLLFSNTAYFLKVESRGGVPIKRLLFANRTGHTINIEDSELRSADQRDGGAKLKVFGNGIGGNIPPNDQFEIYLTKTNALGYYVESTNEVKGWFKPEVLVLDRFKVVD